MLHFLKFETIKKRVTRITLIRDILNILVIMNTKQLQILFIPPKHLMLHNCCGAERDCALLAVH
jgi:hypothetical protein